MANWIYCATAAQVDATNTQSLLRANQAIWCPPPGHTPWPGTLQDADRIWLVWRDHHDADPTFLLGGGRLQRSPRYNLRLFNTDMLWSEVDLPGVRSEAARCGYPPLPTNMSFLRLQPAFLLADALHQLVGLGLLQS